MLYPLVSNGKVPVKALQGVSPVASGGASAGVGVAVRKLQVSPLREERKAAGQRLDDREGLALMQVVG